ncbi:hypothetical protein [Burkholderia sp. BCC1977]|uniref:hypothetical protein n=1 Tax=Burkholderia sp. BCC1977 TaxID=2817440 RepID=UPI002ABDFC3F|nr:hypothetical protein [Burkholderia sp. BCC1977]
MNSAVGDADKTGLGAVGARANAFRDQLKGFAAIEGNAGAANRLGSEFESYFGSANDAARLLMGLDKGDAQSAVKKMRESSDTVKHDLDATHKAAQSQFALAVAATEDGIRFILGESIGLDLPDFFGPFQSWRTASVASVEQYRCLNSSGVR